MSIHQMRIAALILFMSISAGALHAQEPSPPEAVPHVVSTTTVVRPAPTVGAMPGQPTAQILKGATVDVVARDRDWVRVRLEGWVREADVVIADTTLRVLSAADIRSNPARSRGKLVRWEVEAVSLQIADALRPGFTRGEPYLLALGPGAEKSLVYIAVPPTLLPVVRSLRPLAPLTVTARIRNGRSEPAGVPILDLQSLIRR